MASPLSMTTISRAKRPNRFLWRVRRSESGELRLIPIRKKRTSNQGGTIQATLTSRVVMDDRTRDVIAAVAAAGGSVSSVRGRLMTVETTGDSIEAVGDALDSFGSQWNREQ